MNCQVCGIEPALARCISCNKKLCGLCAVRYRDAYRRGGFTGGKETWAKRRSLTIDVTYLCQSCYVLEILER